MGRTKVAAKKLDSARKIQNSKSKTYIDNSKTIMRKKTAPALGGMKKRRFRPGTVALREIKKY